MIYDLSNIDLYNHIYLPLLFTETRYNIVYGGRDSGKSDFIAQWHLIKLLGEQFCRPMFVRKYFAQIKDTQWQTMVDQIRRWELQNEFHITTNPLAIACRKTGNHILCRGLDKPDNAKSVKDPTSAWYEEGNQIPKEAFWDTGLSLRTSQEVPIKEWISFNPQNESFFVNEQFFPIKNTYEKEDGNFHWVKSIRPNTTILHTNYKDNRFVTRDRIQTIEGYKNIDLNYYKVNTLGLWGGALRGLIYNNWTGIDSIPDGGDEVIGIDPGFNNATAITRVVNYDGDLFLQELAYVTNHTHPDIVKLMMTPELRDIIGKKLIIVDSAAPEFIKLLKNSGFNARPADKGPDSVYKGILMVKQFNMYVTKDSQNLIRELQCYVWKETKEGVALDEPVKVEDHACDSVRYVVQTYGRKYWIKNQRTENSNRPQKKFRNDIYSDY